MRGGVTCCGDATLSRAPPSRCEELRGGLKVFQAPPFSCNPKFCESHVYNAIYFTARLVLRVGEARIGSTVYREAVTDLGLADHTFPGFRGYRELRERGVGNTSRRSMIMLVDLIIASVLGGIVLYMLLDQWCLVSNPRGMPVVLGSKARPASFAATISTTSSKDSMEIEDEKAHQATEGLTLNDRTE